MTTRPSVLVVDDEFGLAEIVCEALGDRGYDVLLASNGEDALGFLAENHVDLVLLDVMMPLMDGPTLLARMRNDPLYREIPVIMMSAFPLTHVERTVDPQGFLQKPFTFGELMMMLEPLVATYSQERAAGTQ